MAFPDNTQKLNLRIPLSMQLQYKPDFEETKIAWRHFWAREKWKRPLIHAPVPRIPGHVLPSSDNPFELAYQRKMTGKWDDHARRIDRYLETMLFPAETVPCFTPDLGPDQFAAFLGPDLQFSQGSLDTNWIAPVVEDWGAFEFRLNPENPTWKAILELSRQMAEHARGRYLVSTCDLHSNADTLSALRNPERLCLDFLDEPEQIEHAMREVRALYPKVYDGLYKAAGANAGTGTISWIPTWSDGKFAVIQCDFICMVGTEIARRFILPALEEEAAFLDQCIYHLDGPGALRHLDDILAIKEIDAIQWASGDGQKPMWQWLDVLKKCQKAGKGLFIYDLNCEQARQLHKELDPAGVVYSVRADSRDEVMALAAWFENHT